jgi:hypothetical protein
LAAPDGQAASCTLHEVALLERVPDRLLRERAPITRVAWQARDTSPFLADLPVEASMANSIVPLPRDTVKLQ